MGQEIDKLIPHSWKYKDLSPTYVLNLVILYSSFLSYLVIFQYPLLNGTIQHQPDK